MKKIILLTIMIGLQQTLSFSQEKEYEYVPFPTSHAVWYVQTMGGSGEKADYFVGYIITGEDTLMNDLVYKKLFIFYTKDTTNRSYMGGVREDDHKRVYYRGDPFTHSVPCVFGIEHGGMFENEVLLYDFSLLVGDTLKAGNFEYIPKGDHMIVTSIDTVKIGNTYRKKFAFNGSPYDWLNWLEGIGNEWGLLDCGLIKTKHNKLDHNLLSCFEHNNEMIYCREDPCDCYKGLVGIEDIDFKENPVKVYPNPVTNKVLYFEFDKLRVDVIEIYNCTGMFAGKYTVGKQHNFQISMETYTAGIYFYKVIAEDGIEYKGILLVH